MSEYEQQMDEHEAICPYCGYNYQVESEDYDVDEREDECSHCGMKYYINQEFTVTHYTSPDCELNDLAHTWEYYDANGRKFRHCTICDILRFEK
jgi:hypothetical protein